MSVEHRRRLQRVLTEAGATISIARLVDWTPAQVIEAFTWASAQIEAHAQDEPGRYTSVKWPAHVSAGNTKTRRAR